MNAESEALLAVRERQTASTLDEKLTKARVALRDVTKTKRDALKAQNKQLSIDLKLAITTSDESIRRGFHQDAVIAAQGNRLAGKIAATDAGF